MSSVREFRDLSLDQRIHEYNRIRHHLVNRVPVILVRGSESAPRVDKQKFLLPKDLTMGQFLWVVRRRLHMASSEALFLFVGSAIVPSNACMREVYDEHVGVDGFLYIAYALENTFG